MKKDRTLNGVTFNRALLSVFTERQRIASNKVPRGVALTKQRAIPRDDSGDDQELLLDECVYEQQSSVKNTTKSRCKRAVQQNPVFFR